MNLLHVNSSKRIETVENINIIEMKFKNTFYSRFALDSAFMEEFFLPFIRLSSNTMQAVTEMTFVIPIMPMTNVDPAHGTHVLL